MKNKFVVIVSTVIFVIVLLALGITIYNIKHVDYGVKVKKDIKPPVKVDILKDGIKVGQAVGAITSWKFNNSIVTSSLISRIMILEKEKSLENVISGDIVNLSTEKFDESIVGLIYEITYNAIDENENIILPIDEIIEYSDGNIQVPILRENINKTLYYNVIVKIKDKGTVEYFFKVEK